MHPATPYCSTNTALDFSGHSSHLFIIDFKSSLSLFLKSRKCLFCAGDLVLFGWRDKTSSFLSSGAREWWGGGWTREDHVLWMEVEYRSAGGDVCNESLDVITLCVIRAFTAMLGLTCRCVFTCSSGLKCISHKNNVISQESYHVVHQHCGGS